jgi:hypothetical protein
VPDDTSVQHRRAEKVGVEERAGEDGLAVAAHAHRVVSSHPVRTVQQHAERRHAALDLALRDQRAVNLRPRLNLRCKEVEMLLHFYEVDVHLQWALVQQVNAAAAVHAEELVPDSNLRGPDQSVHPLRG